MDIITGKDNPHIKEYQKISKNKKYRKEYGLFAAEGLRLCADAAESGMKIKKLFVSVSASEKYGEEAEKIIEKSEKAFYVSEENAAKMADTDSTQGVFALIEMPRCDDISKAVRTGGKYIMLCSLQDAGNVGTIIRTADAVGIDAVIMADCCDVYNPKAVRASMGALFRVPVIAADFDAAMTAFKEHNTETFAAVVDENADEIRKCDFSHGCAVLVGNEGNGLTQQQAEACGHKMTIRMAGHANSLNAAMAAGIIMWEMLRRED